MAIVKFLVVDPLFMYVAQKLATTIKFLKMQNAVRIVRVITLHLQDLTVNYVPQKTKFIPYNILRLILTPKLIDFSYPEHHLWGFHSLLKQSSKSVLRIFFIN